jgi:hypothetical protein
MCLIASCLNFLKAVINYILQASEIDPEKLVEVFTCVSEKGISGVKYK